MASVIINPLIAERRIYYKDNAEGNEPYDLSLNIIWIPDEPGAVTLSMHVAQKPHTRQTLKAMVRSLLELGIHTVYAYRIDNHVLPRAEKLSNGNWKLDLLQFKDRVKE